MKIFLIGMPGSGKTTIGKQAALQLGLPFVDLDDEIVQREGKHIPEIFSQNGEAYFRQVESSLLKYWADSDKDFIMATGGGAPCFYHGIEIINASGVSIFLDVAIDELVSRMEKESGRPLLQVNDKPELADRLQRLRDLRLAFYQQAEIVLQNPSALSVVEAIQART